MSPDPVSPNAINYYSSGEEVLENGTGAWPNPGATQAWVNQEMSKGRSDCAMGSAILNPGGAADLEGGWGFNAWHGSVENRGDWFDEELWSIVTLEAALAIPVSDLRTQPFFRRFQIENLMSPSQGSATAQQPWGRAKTLGGGIPALSFAAGSNPISVFEDRRANSETPGESAGKV
jgi:hypothetical protein